MDPGTPEALDLSGILLLIGFGVLQDEKRALEYFQQAHAAGEANATAASVCGSAERPSV